MTVASTMIPAARPVERILTSVTGTPPSAMKARQRIRAPEVTSRPVRPMPRMTASPVSPVRVVLLVDPGQDEDLVVHRQAEKQGENGERDPERDGAGRRAGEQRAGAVAFLPHEGEHAKRGAQRDEVQQQRLDRQPERPQRPGEQDGGDDSDRDRDDQQVATVEGGDEVGVLGLGAAHPGAGHLGRGRLDLRSARLCPALVEGSAADQASATRRPPAVQAAGAVTVMPPPGRRQGRRRGQQDLGGPQHPGADAG